MNVKSGAIVIKLVAIHLEVSSVLVSMVMSEETTLVLLILLQRKCFYIWHITTKYWPWTKLEKRTNR